MDELKNALDPGNEDQTLKVMSIYGLGGVGKTQLVSSTIGYGYFAPYYPMTHHPCSTPVFSFNCTSVQLLLYTSSAAMVHRRHHLSGHPFHIYIEGLVPYRINRVLLLLIRFNSYGPRPTTTLSLI